MYLRGAKKKGVRALLFGGHAAWEAADRSLPQAGRTKSSQQIIVPLEEGATHLIEWDGLGDVFGQIEVVGAVLVGEEGDGGAIEDAEAEGGVGVVVDAVDEDGAVVWGPELVALYPPEWCVVHGTFGPGKWRFMAFIVAS